MYNTKWKEHMQPVIIALTANAITGDKERYLGIGMDLYISKPLMREALIKALDDANAIVASRKNHLALDSA